MAAVSLRTVAVAGLIFGVSACTPQGVISQGSGSDVVSGAAAGGTAAETNSKLQRCPESLGTLAVDDGREKAWWGAFYANTQITTIEPMIRLIVQQSNCFVITSVGNQRLDDRMSAITEKQRESGEFRAGSNQQKGQRVAADYYMEPAILFANANTGKSTAGLGGLMGGVIGGISGMMSQHSSSVTLSVFDLRSGVQVAASEGSSTATDIGATLGALGFGAGGIMGGGLSAYTSTPEGKAVVAAYVDSYNKMVVALRNYQVQTVKGGLGTGGTLKVQGN